MNLGSLTLILKLAMGGNEVVFFYAGALFLPFDLLFVTIEAWS